jgi:OOP family OmpA-OmpF porin
MIRALLLAALIALSPAPLSALALPAGAERTAERRLPYAEIDLPAGPWRAEGTGMHRAAGEMVQTAWRTALPAGGTAGLIAPLREQLRTAGYAIVYDCAARACGGFDFRFLLDLLPEPAMHVDLGDFAYLLATREGAEGAASAVAVIASRSRSHGHVQLTEVAAGAPGPALPGAAPSAPGPGPAATAPSPPGSLGALLEAEGRVALDDLTFETGAARLGPGPFASLEALAAYLAANPSRRIVLVGHSDAVGALASNVALSRQRAQAVLERLATAHGASRAQMAAEGVGFLAPRATNLTEEGRTRNRRVEAVLVSTP